MIDAYTLARLVGILVALLAFGGFILALRGFRYAAEDVGRLRALGHNGLTLPMAQAFVWVERIRLLMRAIILGIGVWYFVAPPGVTSRLVVGCAWLVVVILDDAKSWVLDRARQRLVRRETAAAQGADRGTA